VKIYKLIFSQSYRAKYLVLVDELQKMKASTINAESELTDFGDGFKELPNEMIIKLSEFFDAVGIYRMSCVNKSWHAIALDEINKRKKAKIENSRLLKLFNGDVERMLSIPIVNNLTSLTRPAFEKDPIYIDLYKESFACMCLELLTQKRFLAFSCISDGNRHKIIFLYGETTHLFRMELESLQHLINGKPLEINDISGKLQFKLLTPSAPGT
jgi:hypothetical protein